MTLSIAPVAATPVQAGGASGAPGTDLRMARLSGDSDGSAALRVRFEPPGPKTGPMDRIGEGVLDRLRSFEQTRTDQRAAMRGVGPGPATALDAAKEKLLGGPASVRPASSAEAAPADSKAAYGDAITAMTRSFDYAIETQLIVKTGSQFSTSASSLMRGQ